MRLIARNLLTGLLGGVFIVATLLFAQSPVASAVQTVPYKMNFQGRLLNSSNVSMADGTYNMRFRIYDGPTCSTGCTAVWTENRLVSSSQGIQVTNGLFSVQLGDVAALNPSLFTSTNLYFEVELPTPASATGTSPVWTEGAMSRNKFGASAFAMNSDTLDGIDGSDYARISTSNIFTAGNSINTSSTQAFSVGNAGTSLFNIDTSNSRITVGTVDDVANLLVLDFSSTDADPTGVDGGMYYNFFKGKFRCFESFAWKDCITSASSSTTLQAAYNNDASGVADIITTSAVKTFLFKAGTGFNSSTLFDIQNAAGLNLFVVDSTSSRIYVGDPTPDAVGALLVLDSSSGASDPTGTAGGMYYNTTMNKFRCFEGNAWKDCTATTVVGTQTISKLTADVVNNSPTANTLQDTGLTFNVTAGNTYRFSALIPYTSAATTTGSRWTAVGPATTFFTMKSTYTITATTLTTNFTDAFNAPAASNASSLATGNLATLEGVITPTSTGTVRIQFASEVANSAITAKAGSSLIWWQQ